MYKKSLKGEILLCLTAIIWGTSFVAQRKGMDYIGPFTFSATRLLIGAGALFITVLLMKKFTNLNEHFEYDDKKTVFKGGISCGLVLFFAVSLQQVGIVYTTAGKAGFITALYIVLVPILGMFLHKPINRFVVIGVAFAVIGLYFLCITDGFSIAIGDAIVLCSTLFWAIHILLVDHFAPKVDGLKMSCIQFTIAGLLSLISAVIFETIELEPIMEGMGPILYAGIVVVGVAYTLQIFGQRGTNPTVAALILSTESVFAVISGMLLLGEVMAIKEVLGCIMMLIAVILAQITPKKNQDTIH